MKGLIRLALPTAACALFAASVPPAGATLATTQENVRHVTTVPGTTGGHVAVEEDRLYMGNYGIGMTIYDVSNPAAPELLGEYRPDRAVADAVPDAAHHPERDIAVLGGTSRAPGTQTTDFLDVTDPANPVVLHTFTAGPGGEAHNADLVDERKLYIPSGGASPNFRIFDYSPLLGETPSAPVQIFGGSLSSMWAESPFREGRPSYGGFSHIHDVEVYTDLSVLLPEEEWVDQDGDEIPDPTYAPRDIVLVAEGGNYVGGNNSGSFFIVDITDPTDPVVRLRWKTTGQAIRYYHEAQLLDADPHVGFISDEDLHNGCEAGGVHSVRFSEDYTEATFLDSWFNGTGTPAPVCSAHVFSSNGPYVFMGSYNAGLQVIDFSDPANLTRAGQYIAEGANSWGALYHEGYVYTGDFGGRGLDVYQFIAAPAGKALVKAGNPASGVADGGISERAAACDPASPANGADGFFVAIPEGSRGEGHVFRAVGSADAGVFDVDVWYYDANCALLPDGHLAAMLPGVAEEGPIPANAAFAAVDLAVGGPQWVYAQIDPAF